MSSFKKWLCLVLCPLLLVGCAPAHPTATGPEQTAASTETEAPTSAPTAPPTTQATAAPTTAPSETSPRTTGPLTTGPIETITNFSDPGKAPIRCVTSPGGLPAQLAGKGYDEAFFAQYALLVVTDTVNSGSIQVNIHSVTRDGDTVTVTLSKEMPGDVGTADMATWLLWATVSKDLADCQWVLAGGAPPSQDYAKE